MLAPSLKLQNPYKGFLRTFNFIVCLNVRQRRLVHYQSRSLSCCLRSDMSEWASLLNGQALLSTEMLSGHGAEGTRHSAQCETDQWGQSRKMHRNDECGTEIHILKYKVCCSTLRHDTEFGGVWLALYEKGAAEISMLTIIEEHIMPQVGHSKYSERMCDILSPPPRWAAEKWGVEGLDDKGKVLHLRVSLYLNTWVHYKRED